MCKKKKKKSGEKTLYKYILLLQRYSEILMMDWGRESYRLSLNCLGRLPAMSFKLFSHATIILATARAVYVYEAVPHTPCRIIGLFDFRISRRNFLSPIFAHQQTPRITRSRIMTFILSIARPSSASSPPDLPSITSGLTLSRSPSTSPALYTHLL